MDKKTNSPKQSTQVKGRTPKQFQYITQSLARAGTLSRTRRLAQGITCAFFGGLAKLFMTRHCVKIHNKSRLLAALHDRPKGIPLITVANHSCNLDEPLLWTYVLRLRDLFNGCFVRWTGVAGDILFINRPYASFFTLGKCAGVWRNIRCRDTGQLLFQGEGVYQPGMEFLLDRLGDDGWVQLLPQGRVMFGDDLEREKLIRFKWGVGRLIADSQKTPIVLPIWHCGFEQINPMKKPYLWYIMASLLHRYRITVCVGEPIHVADLVDLYRAKEISSIEARKKITDRIEHHMFNLKDATESLHLDHLKSKF